MICQKMWMDTGNREINGPVVLQTSGRGEQRVSDLLEQADTSVISEYSKAGIKGC